MTYNVFGGTLNLAHSINQPLKINQNSYLAHFSVLPSDQISAE